MAAKRIPQLDPVSAANVDNGDSLVLFDAGADETKRVLRSNLLANNSGASVVGYTQGGSGASDRTVQSKLRDIVSVKDFGAVGDGVTDDTAAIQAALDAHDNVFVPAGTHRCDGTIVIAQNKTLVVEGSLYRLSAYSASTRPVVKLFGNYAALFGYGVGSVVGSQNDSPNGVVLWGAEDPTTEYTGFRFATVHNLRIIAFGPTGSSKGLALQNSQYWIGGALYDGHFSNLHIRNAKTSIYLNRISNANTFNNINAWNTELSIHCDGVSGGLVTDCNFSNLFTDGSSSVHQYGVLATFTLHTNFVNMNGEAGAGRLANIDNTCSRITFIGVDNHSLPPIFNAAFSFYTTNGTVTARDLSADTLEGGSLTVVGGTTRFAEVDVGGNYNRLDIRTDLSAFSGSGGVSFRPANVPGSGTAQYWTYFRDITSGAGTTKHNVAVDGDFRAASFGIAGGSSGASGTFTTTDGKTVTVTNGIITAIV